MQARHRNKAVAALSVWLVLAVALIVEIIVFRRRDDAGPMFKNDLGLVLFWFGMIAQLACYSWGCYHLAKAKGQDVALLLLGFCPPFQLVALGVLLVLPDKFRHHRSRSEQTD